MKSLARNTVYYGFAFFLLQHLYTGVRIAGGFPTYLVGGFALTLMLFFVKPVINVLTLPLNLITLGLFSLFTNVIILYLLTVLMPSITIQQFTFPGINFAGFVVPSIDVNAFFAYVLCTMTISGMYIGLTWISKD